RLVPFHTAHKLLLLAHNDAAYRRLGKLVGSAGTLPDAELFARYEAEFQNALRTKATVQKHVNVLQHAMGHLKTMLNAIEKREVLGAINDYRAGLLPLIVPMTLMRYNIRRHGIEYLAGQLYFDPHPKELMLRNHA
ncbi:MAG: YbgA family protein, partial [Planctomycetes bacterium]|nr:YbgA family protein [Planctomycetota bacterium]